MALKSSPGWDYSDLASSYDKRPDYSPEVVERLLDAAWRPSARACDIGAGTARLTLPLARRGFHVVALEPNPSMMRLGLRKTRGTAGIDWVRGLGETIALRGGIFDLVAFGSSWNVVDRPPALREASRLLKYGGCLACLFNHRDLNDPLQRRIETWIHEIIPGYDYGVRREDLTPQISTSGLFGEVRQIQAGFVAEMSLEDSLQAWRSHATLRRQAGDRFGVVLEGIRAILLDCPTPLIQVPYRTSLWMARKRPALRRRDL